MLRTITAGMALLLITLLIIPAIVVQFIPKGAGQVLEEKVDLTPQKESYPTVHVAVYRMAKQIIEKVPLEEYIRGVVASEMPADFELEALKAQALAARTYIIRRLVEGDLDDTPEGSVVTDGVKHQVYQSEEELRQHWGADYDQNINRMNQAINDTIGLVLTYENKPIDATFFSTSNGFTENSEDYWGANIPYLRSVESPWDKASPRYTEQMNISVPEFEKKLGVTISSMASTEGSFSEILSRTEGNRIQEIEIGEKVFSGKDVRELLDLNSSHFEWKVNNGQVIIDTMGWGHGVGMSQWGANGMAREGYTAEDIVQHYYQDIEIGDYRKWIVKN